MLAPAVGAELGNPTAIVGLAPYMGGGDMMEDVGDTEAGKAEVGGIYRGRRSICCWEACVTDDPLVIGSGWTGGGRNRPFGEVPGETL
jgi:hypothetical protein